MKNSIFPTLIRLFLISLFTYFVFSITLIPTYAATFSDVSSDHWAYNYIQSLSIARIINGNDDGTFDADGYITRGQLSKVLVGCSGMQAKFVSTSSYDDVSLKDWYSPFIESLAIYYMPGYVNKDGQPFFRPNAPATREQIAYSIIAIKRLTKQEPDIDKIKSKYRDFDNTTESFKKYVAIAIEKGYLKGYEDGTFKPKNNVSRAEACTILYRAFSDDINKKISTFYNTDPQKDINDANIYVSIELHNQDEVYIKAEDIIKSTVIWEKKIATIDGMQYENRPQQAFSNKVLENNGIVYAQAYGTLYGFIKSSGQQVVKVPNVGKGEPFMDNGTIFCTSNGTGFSSDPFLLALNIDGSLKWSHYDMSDEGLFVLSGNHGITQITQDEIYVRCNNVDLLEAYAIFDKSGHLLRVDNTIVRDSEPRDRYGNILQVSDIVTRGTTFYGRVEKIDGHKVLVYWYDLKNFYGDDYSEKERKKLLSFYGITLNSSKWEEDKDLVISSSSNN